jgi:hypothetical protein
MVKKIKSKLTKIAWSASIVALGFSAGKATQAFIQGWKQANAEKLPKRERQEEPYGANRP